jgi:hypothetical protein
MVGAGFGPRIAGILLLAASALGWLQQPTFRSRVE